MYLSAAMTVDPAQATIIEQVKPTKVFNRILHCLTAGLSSPKNERETFTAVSILQQINIAARAAGITNIVRLARDDFDFYLDQEGKKDDLQDTLDLFDLEMGDAGSEIFSKLYLVLEHRDHLLKYLLEIDILRTHDVGEHPICIKINGVLKSLAEGTRGSEEQIKASMSGIFESQESFEKTMHRTRAHFEGFVASFEMEIRKAIRVDAIETRPAETNVIRANKKITTGDQVDEIMGERRGMGHEPIACGYFGFGSYFLTSMLWTNMMFSHNMYCHNTSIVDSSGHKVAEVGDEGFYAGDYNTLNADEQFEPPGQGDVALHDGNEFESEIAASGADLDTYADASDSTGSGDSWFDFGGGGDNGGSSCSSCSSCGGCGGD